MAQTTRAHPRIDRMRVMAGVDGGGTVTVSLPLNPSPDVPAPKIANFTALQGFDVSQPLTIQWNAFSGASQNDSIRLAIAEKNGPLIFFAPNPCVPIELPATDTSITIPAGTFETNITYELELTFSRVTHTGTDTLEGFAEFLPGFGLCFVPLLGVREVFRRRQGDKVIVARFLVAGAE